MAASADRVVVGAAAWTCRRSPRSRSRREDRVREVIHNFNDDGFDSLAPEVRGRPAADVHAARSGGRSRRSRCPGRPITICRSRPGRLSKLAEFLVAEGVVDDISHEGLRVLLREEGVSFQVIKTFKASNDPDFEAKKNRVARALRHRRRQGAARAGRSDGGDLHGRVRAAQPAAPSRQAVGAGRCRQGRHRPCTAATAAAGHLHPPARGAAPAGRLRPVHRPALRAHQDAQGPHRVPGVLPLPALAVPARGADRDRAGQLQPAPVHQEGPAASATGPRRTTSSSPTCRSTRPG